MIDEDGREPHERGEEAKHAAEHNERGERNEMTFGFDQIQEALFKYMEVSQAEKEAKKEQKQIIKQLCQ